ncbi:hypothetical protein J1614_002291 [Plenodomus biglobosus]|nr:hypothetical protein J1614_002291 [Plenodomus biglobosus]
MSPPPPSINTNQQTNPAPSPEGRAVPSPGKTPSPIITSKFSSLTPPASATALRNNLDWILRGLTPSPSTSSTAQTLSSPLPPSRMENIDLIAHNDLAVEGSSEDGKEDELSYGEEQFDYGDEASDGYEDEDKSMTSSDENDANFEAKGKGQSDGKKDDKNGESQNSEEAAVKTSNPAFSNAYVHGQQSEIRKRENEGSQDDVMEEVLNTSYLTGRTASNHCSSGLLGAGHGVIPGNEQTRRNILRALINKELTQDWEQQRHRLPQAAAEEDRYDSDTKSEWLLEGESTESEEKV